MWVHIVNRGRPTDKWETHSISVSVAGKRAHLVRVLSAYTAVSLIQNANDNISIIPKAVVSPIFILGRPHDSSAMCI